MSWDDLFADLEVAPGGLDDAADVAERTRAEVARVPLVDRLRAAVGRHLAVRLSTGARLEGELRAAGPGWLLLLDAAGEALVALQAVVVVEHLPVAVAPPAGAVASRLGLASVLRGVARDRSAVRVELCGPATGPLTGTVDRVGADHLDLAQHAVDEVRRPGAVRGVVVVPLEAVACVRRASPPGGLS